MPEQPTNWRQLYSMAVILGAGFGLLLSVGGVPSAPDWPADWGSTTTSPLAGVLIPVAGGALVGLILAGAAHLGVRYQLRRRSGPRTG